VTVNRILIVGASGLVGRALCRLLPPARYLATYFSHPVPGAVRYDIMQDDLNALLPANVVFTHAVILSAESKIDACIKDPVGTQRLNVESPIRLSRELAARGVQPVFFSSEYVFDGRRGNYSEQDDPNPTTVYGKQKLAAEQAILQLDGCLVLRLAKTLGVDPNDGSQLTDALRRMMRGETIRAATDQIFSPIAATDAARLILGAIDARLSGLYHLGGPQPWSRYDLTQLLARTWAGKASIESCSLDEIGLLDARPKNVSLNSARLYGVTGVRPGSMASLCEEVVARAAA